MTNAARISVARNRGLEEAANALLRFHPNTCGCRCEETADQAAHHEDGTPWEHTIECAAWWDAQEQAAIDLLVDAGWTRASATRYARD